MEQVVGIEPTLTVWKTVVLAVIRYLHINYVEDAFVDTEYPSSRRL